MSEPIRVGGHWKCPKCGESYHSSIIHECGAHQRFIEESMRKAMAEVAAPTDDVRRDYEDPNAPEGMWDNSAAASDDAKPYTREELEALIPSRLTDGSALLYCKDYERLRATARAGLDDTERFRQAIVTIRAHTGRLPDASIGLLNGLLASVERIADEALGTTRSGRPAPSGGAE